MTDHHEAAIRLPNISGDGRRAKIERRLDANVQRRTILSAHLNADRKTYRVVTASGTEFPKVSLAAADMICSVAMSAYNEGVAQQG